MAAKIFRFVSWVEAHPLTVNGTIILAVYSYCLGRGWV